VCLVQCTANLLVYLDQQLGACRMVLVDDWHAACVFGLFYSLSFELHSGTRWRCALVQHLSLA
jgi:hypothetical protein